MVETRNIDTKTKNSSSYAFPWN